MGTHAGAKSPNFAFLAGYEPHLTHAAAKAERFVFDEPRYALLQLRIFGETFARQVAARANVHADERENQIDRLRRLRDLGLVEHQQAELLHTLRRRGNEAAHNDPVSRSTALHALRFARRLAVWYHRAFKHPTFKAGPFVAPPMPVDAATALRIEVTRLREALARSKARLDAAESTSAQQAEQLARAEQEAARAYAESRAALALAEETESDAARVNAEKAALEAHVAALEAAAAAAPEETEQVVAQLKKTSLDMDEAETRLLIDEQLRAAGWQADSVALTKAGGAKPQKGRNLAIAEYQCVKGRADYVLFAGLTPVGIVEAKKWSTDVAGSIGQAEAYSAYFPVDHPEAIPPTNAEGKPQWGAGVHGTYKIPFVFATNGRPYLRQLATKSGIWFRDVRRPTNHARALDGWPTPEGLLARLAHDPEAADAALAAAAPDGMPLRDYQRAAITAVEDAIASGQRDIMLAMATGTGKTRTALCLMYRLLHARRFERVLFLVDRTALGTQALQSFEGTKLDGQMPITRIYDIKGLDDAAPEATTRVHIATIQAMVRRVTDEDAYVPVDTYDCIIVDECHRGYHLDREMTDGELSWRSESDYISKYRRVLDHFDAVRIGLTATPAQHTTRIFGKPVFRYSYRQAVVDGHLADHEPPFQITTRLARNGIHFEAGTEVSRFDPKTGQIDLFETPDEVDIEIDGFNTRVITRAFNEAVCAELVRHIDPGGPGKVLVFCATDAHCDLVVDVLKQAFVDEYGELHDKAVQKITGAAHDPAGRIRHYKNETHPTIAVTVDLLTTGIDVPPIDTLVFLRRVKSRILYEQMIGRATRKCDDIGKTTFRIFDAVELYRDMDQHSDMKPVVARPRITFAALIDELARADDEHREIVRDQLLAKFNARKARIVGHHAENFEAITGMDPAGFVEHLRHSAPDALTTWLHARPQLAPVLDGLVGGGPQPVWVSDAPDDVIAVTRGYGKGQRPDDYLDAFHDWLTTHQNRLDALVVVTQRPRDLTRAQLRELKLALDAEGYSETALRAAFAQTTNQDIAASIIGYIRQRVLGEPLMPYALRVERAVQRIIARNDFNAKQRKWIERIGKQIAEQTVIDRATLDEGEFERQGGARRIDQRLDGRLDALLGDLHAAIWDDAG